MTHLRGSKVTAMIAVTAAVLFAAGCGAASSAPAPSSTAVVKQVRATSTPTAASALVKPVSSPAVTVTVTAAPLQSSSARASASQQPSAPAAPATPVQSGAELDDSATASSSTPAVPASTPTPPPCVLGVCLPWVWFKPTSVIDNNALLPIPTFGSSLDNNTPGSSTLTDTVTGTVTVSAQLSGKIGASPSAADIAGATAEIDPQVAASASITETKTVDIQVPKGDQGVIMFGVPAVEVAGDVLVRGVTGQTTSTPIDAWVPVYPVVFGFNAYVTPLTGNGPKSELPVIPIPAA